MISMFDGIEQTLNRPEKVVQSLSDPTVQLYYRFYRSTVVGDKYICVIVKRNQDDAFILSRLDFLAKIRMLSLCLQLNIRI